MLVMTQDPQCHDFNIEGKLPPTTAFKLLPWAPFLISWDKLHDSSHPHLLTAHQELGMAKQELKKYY